MNGANWQIATANHMANKGISDCVDKNGSATLTREEAAQYCLEALSADVVSYDNKGTTVALGGATVTTAASKAEPDNTNPHRNDFNDGDGNLQLGEKLYKNKLIKTVASDSFGNDATSWTWKASAVGTFADEADASFTKKMTYADLYSTLGSTIVNNLGDVNIWVDGHHRVAGTNGVYTVAGAFNGANITSSNSAAFGFDAGVATWLADDTRPTGNGVLTNIFWAYDSGDEKYDVTISVTNTYLAKAAADYDTVGKKLTVTIYDAEVAVGNSTIKASDFSAVESMKKDDFFYVTATTSNEATYTIKTVTPVPADKIVLDAVVSGYTAQKTVTAGGNTYTYAAEMADPNAAGNSLYATPTNYTLNSGSYDLILDQYGYVLGQKVHSTGVKASDYLFIPSHPVVDGLGARARAIFMDGTSDTITIRTMKDINNTTYSAGAIVSGTSALSTTCGTYASNDPLANLAGYTPGQLDYQEFYKFTKRSDGTYDLTAIAGTAEGNGSTNAGQQGRQATATNVAKNTAQAFSTITNIADDNTILVVGSTVYAGVKNFPTISGASEVNYVTDATSNRIVAARAVGTASNTATAQYVYLFATPDVSKSGDLTKYTYNVVKDGAVTTVDTDAGTALTKGLYDISTTDKDGLVTGLTVPTTAASTSGLFNYYNAATTTLSVDDGVITTDSSSKVLADDCVFYYIDSLKTDANVEIYSAAAVSALDTATYDYEVYGFGATSTSTPSSVILVVKTA